MRSVLEWLTEFFATLVLLPIVIAVRLIEFAMILLFVLSPLILIGFIVWLVAK